MELSGVRLCRSSRILPNSLWRRPARTFLRRLRQGSSQPSYSSCIALFSWCDHTVLELLRSRQRDQCASHDTHSGAIHRSDFRRDAVATATTESAAALQDLAISSAVWSRLDRLVVHVCLR